jgi:hypothetical protein
MPCKRRGIHPYYVNTRTQIYLHKSSVLNGLNFANSQSKRLKKNTYRYPNEILQSRSQTSTTLWQRNMGNHDARHDSPKAAEMRFPRSVKGYTRPDKIRSEVIRKELEISGIQNVRSKHRQNWINHLERVDNTRLPKHALNCKPRGRRDRGRPRKRWQRVDAGTRQTT